MHEYLQKMSCSCTFHRISDKCLFQDYCGYTMHFCIDRIICGDDEFTCITTGLCIPSNLTCDGQRHCFDASDERPEFAGCGKC